ncbi:MAG: hypothetical protein ACKV0T_09225 [Planctomycetales bacterium]
MKTASVGDAASVHVQRTETFASPTPPLAPRGGGRESLFFEVAVALDQLADEAPASAQLV